MLSVRQTQTRILYQQWQSMYRINRQCLYVVPKTYNQ